jgi:hypothetical protein
MAGARQEGALAMADLFTPAGRARIERQEHAIAKPPLKRFGARPYELQKVRKNGK